MFLYYKNFGTEAMDIHIVRAIVEDEGLRFEEEIVSTSCPENQISATDGQPVTPIVL
jgi:hypothetical protein